MKLISLGDVNFKLIYILIGGLAKLVAELILYFFEGKIEMNNHPFILGINASLGMILAFIPDLILKSRLKNKITKEDEIILLGDRRKKFKRKLKKFCILFLCCFFDFTQKLLSFLYPKYVLNNIWIFDIIFIGLLSWLILNLKLYKHQYFSSLIMIIFGIILNVINFEYEGNPFYCLVLSFVIEIFHNLDLVLSKYLMDSLFMTPFEITYIEGIFAFVLNFIFLSISTNNELNNPPLLIDLAYHCKYKDKTYLDNFFAYWDEFKGTEILAFVVQMFSRGLFNLFGHIIAKDFTPSHIIFLLMIGEIFLVFKKFEPMKLASLFIILIELFMLLIFTEIIELNFCGLEYNTKKNIKEREKLLAELDSKSDDSGDIGDGIQLKEISEKDNSSSLNNSLFNKSY